MRRLEAKKVLMGGKGRGRKASYFRWEPFREELLRNDRNRKIRASINSYMLVLIVSSVKFRKKCNFDDTCDKAAGVKKQRRSGESSPLKKNMART